MIQTLVMVSFRVTVVPMWVSGWHNKFNFRNRHEWEEAQE
jgi:hypothetical protein